MKAKDTVMKKEQAREIVSVGDQIEDILQVPIDKLAAVCKAQAEISFKAGIKEVVEWIKASGDASLYNQHGDYTDDWQAKLKEWGIK